MSNCQKSDHAANPDSSGSLLNRLLKQFSENSSVSLSFEDLTGITIDNPQLDLSYSLRIHTCRFCEFAKSRPDSHQYCVRNKMAANRVAIQQRKGFTGQCHLGLTDLVKPLIYNDTVLGVFYYGSFVTEETFENARHKILRFCRRNNFDPEPYLEALHEAPKLDVDIFPELWQKLDLVADLSLSIVESIGIPIERYRTRPGAQFSTWNGTLPPLIRKVISYINNEYSEPIRVFDIAEQEHCNPDYLSRCFKKSVGFGLVQYLHRVRIDHARRLLQTERFTVGEVGHLVGFEDQSHFGKVFLRFVGMTPKGYRDSMVIRSDHSKAFSTFEYSNSRPFNPKFSEGLVEPDRLVM